MIKSILLCFLLLAFCFTAKSQSNAFEYLKKAECDSISYVKYQPDITTVYMTRLKDLDKNDPLFDDFIEVSKNVKVLRTKIDRNSDQEYIIVFDHGISADYGFLIYKLGEYKRRAFYVPGRQLFLPGNGNVYASGHSNNYFNMRRKYQLKNDELCEVKQACYYVGLSSRTFRPLTIYQSKLLQKEVATLPANYSIEVLAFDKETECFLLKTKFGLLGWCHLGTINQQAEKIKGIFFAGD